MTQLVLLLRWIDEGDDFLLILLVDCIMFYFEVFGENILNGVHEVKLINIKIVSELESQIQIWKMFH